MGWGGGWERESEGDAAKSEEREGVSPQLFEAGQRDSARSVSLKEEIGARQPRCGAGGREYSTFL